MNLIQKILASSIITGLSIGSAMAANITGNFQTTASLSGSCVISATNVAFGSITPAATGNATATGTITSTCSKGVSGVLNLNAGTNGTVAARKMGGTTGNTDKLGYNIYIANDYAQIFGDGTGSSVGLSSLGTGVADTKTIYGQLPLNQYLKPDTYTDNLTVTLTY